MLTRFFLCILISGVKCESYNNSTEEDTQKHKGVSELLSSIVTQHFPSCGVVLVSDAYFKTYLVRWLEHIRVPIWTIDLTKGPVAQNANKANHDSSDFSGCTTIIVCCLTKESCRTEYSEPLFHILLLRGIIRSVRRSFLYIKSEAASTPTINYERENTIRFSTDAMNDAKAILLEIQSHITLIRRVKIQNGLRRSSPTYQLLTFTPNWIPGGSPVIEAYWSLKLGLVGGIQLKLQYIRSAGSTIRGALATFNLPPYIQVKDGKIAKGIEASAMKLILRRFNITVQYHEAKDFTFGKKTKSGTWSSVIRDVVERNSDFGLGQILFTYDRKETGLKFSNTIMMLRGAVVCPAPDFLSSWLTLTLPFKMWVWIALLAAVILVLGLAEIIQFLIRHCWKQRRRLVKLRAGRLVAGPVVKPPKMLSCVYFVASAFQKSIPGKFIPQGSGLRLYFGFWSIFTFMTSSFYGSILVSKWAVRPTAEAIDSVEDLVQYGQQWSISQLVMETLQNGHYSVEQQLVEEAFSVGSENNFADQSIKEIEYVLETGNCVVAERTRAKYVITNKLMKKQKKRAWKTALRLGKEAFLLGPSGWVLRSDTDFIFYNIVNNITRNFREMGFIHRAARDYFPSNVNANSTKSNKAKPLTLKSFAVPFYLLLCGLLLSLVALGLEVVFFGLKEIRRLQQLQNMLDPKVKRR